VILDFGSQGSVSHSLQKRGGASLDTSPGVEYVPLQTMPERASPSISSEQLPSADPPGESWPRVLLADDHRDLQSVLARQLTLIGLEVVGVTNGRDAVDLALAASRSGCPFALVLMDLEMPILDGYEATRRLREGGFTGPILALSAHSTDDFRQESLSAGCNDCLCKPFDGAQLAGLICKYLPGHILSGTLPRPQA
jgi:CheY-like chemotaxis protein